MQEQPAAGQQLVKEENATETSSAIHRMINPFRLAGVSAYPEYFMNLLTPPAKVVPAAAGNAWQALGGEVVLKLAATDTAGRLTLLEQVVAPGSGMPLHLHTQEDKVLLVMAGHLEVFIGDALHTLEVGDVVLLPRSVPHAFRVLSEIPVRLLIFLTPGGLEGMFQELAQLPAGLPDRNLIATIYSRYGVSFL